MNGAFPGTFLSLQERADSMRAFLFGVVSASFGVIFSLFLGVSPAAGIGIGVFVFFTGIFLKNSFLFLLFIIPFRMMLDYFGDVFSVQIFETLFLSLSQLIGLLVFVIGVLFFLLRARSKPVFREFLPFWIFFIWGVCSLTFSIAPGETIRDLLRVFDILALASMAFCFTKTRDDFRRILLALLASAFIPLLFGLWQWVTGNVFTKDLFVDLSRVYGTFGHPNVFGLYLFCIIVLAFLFYRIFARTAWEKIFVSGIGAVSFVVIFPTLSRVSWAILFLFFLIVGIVRFRKMVFPVVFIFAFLFFAVPAIQDRIVDIFQVSADSSVLWRINIWRDGIHQVFSEGRFLYGFGLDTFPTVITSLHTKEFGSADAHNDPVKFFVEGGILGFFVYVFWMGWFFVRLFLLFLDAQKRSKKDAEIYFMYFIFFLCIGAASLSDAVFKSTPLQWTLWISIGALLGFTVNKKTS